jgi:cytochrome c553
MRAPTWLFLLPLTWLLAACGAEENPAPGGGATAGGNTPAETPVTPPAKTPAKTPAEQPVTPPAEQPVKPPVEAGAPAHSAAAIAAADTTFKTVCAVCHGAEGKGDAPAAAGFPVKPKDLSDTAWQASVDDAYLSKIITEGGAAVGKSPLMTGAPDLKAKPEVLAALVAKIRGFSK